MSGDTFYDELTKLKAASTGLVLPEIDIAEFYDQDNQPWNSRTSKTERVTDEADSWWRRELE
jgi:hypothetical protein